MDSKGDKSRKVKKRKIKKENSSITIGDGNEIDSAVIGQNIENVTIIKSPPDNSVKYEIDKEDVTFLKKISPHLIGRFGKKKIGLTGAISFIFSIIGILTGINSTTPNVRIYPYLPAFPNNYANSVLISSFILLALAVILFVVMQYHASNQCKKCNKEYAYEEVGTPTVKEIETSEGIRKDTTSVYECKFCGDLDVRKDSELLEKSEE